MRRIHVGIEGKILVTGECVFGLVADATITALDRGAPMLPMTLWMEPHWVQMARSLGLD